MSTEQLFEQLKHPNPNLRERAMIELAEYKDQEIINRLMEILGAEDVTYRRAAVKALGYIGVQSVPLLVEALLNSDNAIIRSSCAKALAQVAFNHPGKPFPEIGLQGLKIALDDPNPVVHISVVMALGEIGVPALEILLTALKNSDNVALGVAIINELGSLADQRSKEVLTSLSQDEFVDPYLKESAISALSRLDMVMNYNK